MAPDVTILACRLPILFSPVLHRLCHLFFALHAPSVFGGPANKNVGYEAFGDGSLYFRLFITSDFSGDVTADCLGSLTCDVQRAVSTDPIKVRVHQ